MDISSTKNGILLKIIEYFPTDVSRFIADELARRGGLVFEIRLRAAARSSILFDSGMRFLPRILGEKELNDILLALTGGALYAHRDTLTEGYVTPANGVRVGVCGRLRYDGGAAVGLAEVRSLVFRIPHSQAETGDRIFDLWRSSGRGGMLVCSPPLGGKTTAIRRLADRIGKEGTRVVVVDERCEFFPEEYSSSEVDILRGYKKSKGIEIAVRTLGAGVVIVDEIGVSETSEVLSSMALGIPFIATVHARSAEEILKRPVFRPFLEARVFDSIVGIRRVGASFSTEQMRLGDLARIGQAEVV